MSVTVRHLNADSSFQLIFSPEPHPTASDLRSANGAYSVLIDPWLVGSSITTAPWFAITNRVVPSCIQHLSELADEPDVVICSQNKADHTNKDTLLQLRPEGKTIIVAEPAAAKAIKSWDHFDPNRIHAMARYDAKVRFGNSFRLHVPALSPDGDSGEINISFIPAKNYMTGLHNAFGITYQAPTRSKTLAPVTTVDLPKTRYFHLPLSPTSMPATSPSATPFPISPKAPTPVVRHDEFQNDGERSAGFYYEHRPQLSRSTNTASSELLTFSDQPSMKPADQGSDQTGQGGNKYTTQINFCQPTLLQPFSFDLPTPPLSPQASASIVSSPLSTPFSHNPSMSSMSSNSPSMLPRWDILNQQPTLHPARPKAVSILYMPHGMSLSELKPYISNHLVRLPGALPLTLLLHAFDFAQNPWYLGGNIMTGAAGGVDIAKALMARCWLSAHDEPKDDRGVAVKKLKLQRTAAEEIRRTLLMGDENKASGWVCDVRSLDVGKEILLSGDARDLCASNQTMTDSATSTASLMLYATNSTTG